MPARPYRPRPRQAERDRTLEIHRRLEAAYSDARIGLQHRNPLELLIATILSAQCTDARVNLVTPALFDRYGDAAAFAKTELPELERLIHSTGFFRAKARNIQGCCRALLEHHRGDVPDTMEGLTSLPGVGRKTANVVLGDSFGVPGVVVDTHVKRISRRLGLTRQTDPEKIERDLMARLPREVWTRFGHLVIAHGRRCCKARKPACRDCSVEELCPSGQKEKAR